VPRDLHDGMRSILVLGSTGSIGTQTLDVVRAARGALRIDGLAAGSSFERVIEQVREFVPRFVALADPAAAERVRAACGAATAVLAGPDALRSL
jgi:1-deoxy-D-xylulose-5-phosphate reductoisomerase